MKKQLPVFTTRRAEIPQLLDKAIRSAIKSILQKAKKGVNVNHIHKVLEDRGLTVYTQTVKTARNGTPYTKKITKEVLILDVITILESMARHGSIKRDIFFWSIR